MKIGLSQRVLTHNKQVHDSLDRSWYVLLRGHELVPIPNREDLNYPSLAESLDLLILTGGGNERIRLETEISIATEMAKLGKPILGICHGAFLLTEIFEGKTKSGKENHHGVYHHIVYGKESSRMVNSFHNIAIAKHPPNSVSLYSDEDGDCESWIMDNICAIVWHPERMTIPYIPEEIMEATGLCLT